MAASQSLLDYLKGLGLTDAQIQSLLNSVGGTDGTVNEDVVKAAAARYAAALAAGAFNAPTVTNPGPSSGGGTGPGGTTGGGSTGGGGGTGASPPVNTPPPAIPPAPPPGPGVSGTPFYRNAAGGLSSPQDLVNQGAPFGNAQAMVNGFQFGRQANADPNAAPTWFTDPQTGQTGWSSAMDPHFGPYATSDLNMQAAQNQMGYGVYAPNAGMDIPLPSEVGGTGEAHAAVKAYYDTLGSRGLLSGPNALMQAYGPQYGQQAAFADTPVAAGGLGQTPQQIADTLAAYYAKQGLTAQPQQGIAPYTGGGAPPAAVGPQPMPIGGGMYGPPPPAIPTTFQNGSQGTFVPQTPGQVSAQQAFQQNTHVTNLPPPPQNIGGAIVTHPDASHAAVNLAGVPPANPYAAALATNQKYVANLTGAAKNGPLTAAQQKSLAAAQDKVKAFGG